MSLIGRIVFGGVALIVLSAVAYLSLQAEAAPEPPSVLTAVVETSSADRLVLTAASSPDVAASRKVLPSELPQRIPFKDLTRVARDENRVIYTTNPLGEALEVHPDGSQIIHDHKMLVKMADGHTEVRYVTLRAKPPTTVPVDNVVPVQGGDAGPK